MIAPRQLDRPPHAEAPELYPDRCIGLFKAVFALTNGLDTAIGLTNYSQTSSACLLMPLPNTSANRGESSCSNSKHCDRQSYIGTRSFHPSANSYGALSDIFAITKI